MSRPLLEIQNIAKGFAGTPILEDVNFVLGDGEHAALIGRNGAGKTTLLKLILGQEEPDRGEIRIASDVRIGSIAQHEKLPDDQTVLRYLEAKSGREPWACAKMAARFGLRKHHLELACTALSGGYQMRLKVVAMLLTEPNLLILDEPVNFLDLSTLLLLEQFLASYKGAYLVTSHDREFLNNTCTQVVEIERGKSTVFPGTVDGYLAYKHEQKEFVLRTNKKIARQREHLQEFVDRFRYKASKAKQAQSKLKAIAKLTSLDVSELLSTTRIKIPSPVLPNGEACRVDKLTIGYSERVIASEISLDIMRGEHVIFVGANGQGKTTLLKTLVGELSAIGGTVKWWHRAEIGYYAQHVDATLRPEETVLEHLSRHAPVGTLPEELLRMAGNFLFRGDDLEKRTKVLSGGERARLCLAGILLGSFNVLVLDEPTNHLDAETSDALAAALRDYKGTILFVSHARTFAHAIATRVIEVEGGRVRQFPGDYETYVSDLSDRTNEETQTDEESTSSVAEDTARQERRRERRELQRQLDRLEASIKKLDREKSDILAYFFEHPTDYDPERSRKLADIEEEMARQEGQWYAIQEKFTSF